MALFLPVSASNQGSETENFTKQPVPFVFHWEDGDVVLSNISYLSRMSYVESRRGKERHFSSLQPWFSGSKLGSEEQAYVLRTSWGQY